MTLTNPGATGIYASDASVMVFSDGSIALATLYGVELVDSTVTLERTSMLDNRYGAVLGLSFKQDPVLVSTDSTWSSVDVDVRMIKGDDYTATDGTFTCVDDVCTD